jgi:uncharacterized protein YutE (UPF0331/DUF86 family)
MRKSSQELMKAEILHAITQRIGFSLWQLQDLEGVAATYYILLTSAKRGMDEVVVNKLVDDAQSKTFGQTIKNLVAEGKLSADLEPRIQALLKERNWLVHGSRASSRNAVGSDLACLKLINRLDAIAEEALSLLKLIGQDIEGYVQLHGVSTETTDKLASEILKTWHDSDED